jgi:RimJ/RimL family protein N-acetyltransferase
VDTAVSQPDLADEAIRLRAWTYEDLACVRAASEEGIIPKFTTVPAEYTDGAGRAFVERQWLGAKEGQGWSLVIASQIDQKALGSVVLRMRPQAAVAGIGYWLMPAARGQGNASRAVRMLTTWALDQAEFERVEAWVEPGNHASIGLLTRCGYVAEGCLRSFLAFGQRRADVLVFSRIRMDLETSQQRGTAGPDE